MLFSIMACGGNILIELVGISQDVSHFRVVSSKSMTFDQYCLFMLVNCSIFGRYRYSANKISML